MPCAGAGLGQILGEGGAGRGVGSVPGTHLGGPDQARGRVDQAAAVLVFVAMLAARARSREPFDAQVAIIDLDTALACSVDDGHSDGRGMHAAAAFGWWNALGAMAARFVMEGGEIRAFEAKDEDGMSGARIRMQGADVSSAVW